MPEEADRAEGSLVDFANVERYVNEVWVPILAEASRRSLRRYGICPMDRWINAIRPSSEADRSVYERTHKRFHCRYP